LRGRRRRRGRLGRRLDPLDRRTVLANVAEVEEIELTLPNKHYLPVDLERFGQSNPNEIFVPIDEPHGYIEARIRRKG